MRRKHFFDELRPEARFISGPPEQPRGRIRFCPQCQAEIVTLSRRELQLASLVAEGRPNKEIAYCMDYSERTVKVYLSHLIRKLRMDNRVKLALWWHDHSEQVGKGIVA